MPLIILTLWLPVTLIVAFSIWAFIHYADSKCYKCNGHYSYKIKECPNCKKLLIKEEAKKKALSMFSKGYQGYEQKGRKRRKQTMTKTN